MKKAFCISSDDNFMPADAARVSHRSNSGDGVQFIPGCEKTGRVFSRALGRMEGFIQIHGMALMEAAVSLHYGSSKHFLTPSRVP